MYKQLCTRTRVARDAYATPAHGHGAPGGPALNARGLVRTPRCAIHTRTQTTTHHRASSSSQHEARRVVGMSELAVGHSNCSSNSTPVVPCRCLVIVITQAPCTASARTAWTHGGNTCAEHFHRPILLAPSARRQRIVKTDCTRQRVHLPRLLSDVASTQPSHTQTGPSREPQHRFIIGPRPWLLARCSSPKWSECPRVGLSERFGPNPSIG